MSSEISIHCCPLAAYQTTVTWFGKKETIFKQIISIKKKTKTTTTTFATKAMSVLQ